MYAYLTLGISLTEASPKAATLKSYHIYNLQRDELQHAGNERNSKYL